MSSPSPYIDEVPEGIPTALDWVVMSADMATIHAAQRYRCIVELWDDAIRAADRDEGASVLVERSVRLEVAAALRITEHAAGRLMGTGRALVKRYPAVWQAMSRAGITDTHVTIIVDGLDELEIVRDELVGEVLALAEHMPTGPFRRAVKRIVDRERQGTIAERHAGAVTLRHVRVEPGVDGMAWLTAHLPAVEAHAIHGRLTAPLCRGHHTLKHHTHWRGRAKPGGALEWTSPAGRIYLVHPERRIPQFTTDPPPF